MSNRFAGKVAIVTGAGRGIGAATASAFAREGALVVVVARSQQEIEATAAEIRGSGGRSFAIRCDVTSDSDVRAMVATALDRFGGIDILVNNAAINLPVIMTQDMEPEDWRHVIDVNLTGPFLCARAVLPHMVRSGSGKIVNVSSTGGRQGGRGRGPYRAAKAGLINFSQTLAAETHGQGVDVICICPGGVDTEMMRFIAPNRPATASPLMKPEEIARVILFLSSEDSGVLSGTVVDAPGPSNDLYRR